MDEVDRRAFDDYVRRQGEALVRAAYLLTRDQYRAEDLIQTVLVELYRSWGRLRRADDLDRYVWRCLVNTRNRLWRRQWARETPGPVERGGAVDRAVDDESARVDTYDQLLRALQRLPSRQRATVVLRHYVDLSEAECAAVMGCSPGTVKSQTAKGLAKLRTLLAAQNPDGSPVEPAPPTSAREL